MGPRRAPHGRAELPQAPRAARRRRPHSTTLATARPAPGRMLECRVPMEQILEGSLSRFEVPDLLIFLSMGRRTGILVLERPNQETKVFLREGRPVFATSTSDELKLGSLLVRLGKVSAD